MWCLTHLAPERVRVHLYLNEGNYTTYASLRRVTSDYLEAQRTAGLASGSSEPTPMEIDVLQKRLAEVRKAMGASDPAALPSLPPDCCSGIQISSLNKSSDKQEATRPSPSSSESLSPVPEPFVFSPTVICI